MKTGTGLFLISFRIVVTSSIFFIVSLAWVNAQNDTLPRGKALNFPFRKYGISIGNSSSFNGIRVNFRDKNVTNVNGFNATLWIKSYPNIYPVVKGISVGTWPTGRSLHGINVGVLGIVASEGNLDGISLVGGGLGAGKNINGIAIAGLGLGGERNINGLSLSGLFTLH
jgi:hypothetical protein